MLQRDDGELGAVAAGCPNLQLSQHLGRTRGLNVTDSGLGAVATRCPNLLCSTSTSPTSPTARRCRTAGSGRSPPAAATWSTSSLAADERRAARPSSPTLPSCDVDSHSSTHGKPEPAARERAATGAAAHPVTQVSLCKD